MKRLADLMLLREPAHRKRVLGVAVGAFLVLTAMGLLDLFGPDVAIIAGLGWTLFLLSVLIDALAKRDDELGAIYKAVQEREVDDGLIRVYSEVSEVPWHELFEGATRIEVVARFFNNIVAEPRCGRAAEQFFAKGGSVEIVVPSTDIPEVIRTLERQRQPDGMQDGSMAARIVQSIAQLERYRIRSGKVDEPGQVRFCRLNEELNYSGFRFDNDLVFAPYEHHWRTTMAIPLMHFDLRRSSAMREFWKDEFAYLTGRDGTLRPASTADSFLRAPASTANPPKLR